MLAPVAPVVSLDLDEREYGHALTRIDVDTVGRTVFLRGRVPTETVRQRAQVVALAVQPVRAVVNELRVGEDPE